MDDNTKNLVDVFLTIIAMVGAIVGFMKALYEWRVSQRWKRSEYLDKFVDRFESDELLRFASVVLDWTSRTTTYKNRTVTIGNDDVILALRDHREMGGQSYGGEQSLVRDAYDALPSFFCRLDLAIDSGLIDAEPTRDYFKYWVDRFITMDRHPNQDKVLDGKDPRNLAAGYVNAYSSGHAIARLCDRFGLAHPGI
jgi:hypothetical protein